MIRLVLNSSLLAAKLKRHLEVNNTASSSIAPSPNERHINRRCANLFEGWYENCQSILELRIMVFGLAVVNPLSEIVGWRMWGSSQNSWNLSRSIWICSLLRTATYWLTIIEPLLRQCRHSRCALAWRTRELSADENLHQPILLLSRIKSPI